jgi:hypothetical protein
MAEKIIYMMEGNIPMKPATIDKGNIMIDPIMKIICPIGPILLTPERKLNINRSVSICFVTMVVTSKHCIAVFL